MVDLKSEEGRRLARQLVLRSDLLIENFRPGVTDRLGLNYDQLKKEMLASCIFRSRGSARRTLSRDQPAYDQVIQGLVGFMGIQGAGGSPSRYATDGRQGFGHVCGDVGTGGALGAERNGGEGQKVVVKMLDAWASFVPRTSSRTTFLDSADPPAAVAPDVQSFRYLEAKSSG